MPTQDVSQVLELLRTEGGIEPEAVFRDSPFRDELLGLLPGEGPERRAGERLTEAMETLFTRQSLYSRLLVVVCVAIKDLTDMPMAKVLRRVEQARGHLKMPSPSWVSKNMRAANVIDAHPELADLSDIEKLCALERLPADQLREASASGKVGAAGRQVDIRTASRKEIGSAVREVRGEKAKGNAKRTEGRPADGNDDDIGSADCAATSDGDEDLMAGMAALPVQQAVRSVTGATRDGPSPVADRVRAVDLFMENFLSGDRDTVLLLQLAANGRMMERLRRSLPEDGSFDSLREGLEVCSELIAQAQEFFPLPDSGVIDVPSSGDNSVADP